MLSRKRSPAAGFTLVELLAVIVIISLLIGLLLPAVGAVRRAARNTSTSAALGSVSTGLEAFRADGRVGGDYPPSHSDWPKDGGFPPIQLQVNSAYRSAQGGGQWQIQISGAGLLVWALAGADFLGAPGFKPFRSTEKYWARDTDAVYGTQGAGAYAMYPSGNRQGEPVHPRSAPYVDIDRIRYTKNVAKTGANFVIGAERQVLGDKVFQSDRIRDYPFFLDSFGFPILYWRADPAGTQMADKLIDTGNSRGIYHWIDNAALVYPGNQQEVGNQPVLRLASATDAHRLDWKGDPKNYNTTNNPPPGGTFLAYIRNTGSQARLAPQRADSYLLISPGADGIYGSGDDITNFEHHGN